MYEFPAKTLLWEWLLWQQTNDHDDDVNNDNDKDNENVDKNGDC